MKLSNLGKPVGKAKLKAWAEGDRTTRAQRITREQQIALMNGPGPDPNDFPSLITFQGKKLRMTGKVGHNSRTGEPSAEYRVIEEGTDERAWRTISGKIEWD